MNIPGKDYMKIILIIFLSLTLFHLNASVELHEQTHQKVNLHHVQDLWWDEYKTSKMEITAYIKSICVEKPAATMWFLAGGKYGYRKEPATVWELANLQSAYHATVKTVSELVNVNEFNFKSRHDLSSHYVKE